MKRVFPAPLVSVSLFAMWLVLQGSLAAGDLLLAAACAIAIPVACAPLRPLPVRIRHPIVIARLILVVGYDVLRSNLAVAFGVLRSPWRAPRSAFVRIPLDITDPNALASLCMITTVIPGTVWTEYVDGHGLLLHVFEVDDPASFIAEFKARYERPLQEIFE
ncbi:MAG: Na+/H+ antiporter subunit E [Burkholderiales bacterium]|nr:Na+/H+ antiporter subunit E [Burkholderiales bacterium]